MNFSLASNIYSKPWLIDSNYVESVLPILVNGAELPKELIHESKIFAATNGRKNDSIENAPKGSVAILEMNGPLMKNDQFCGPVGMKTIGAWIEQADSNPNIEGIVLKIDSPGGTVDGTEELSAIVKNTKKPIVALVDGLMASAAYWIGSSSDKIITMGKTSRIGSIGTMMSFADMQPLLEAQGVKFHELYATASVDKNADFKSARSGDYSSYINNVLNPLNEVFTTSVKSNRKGKIDFEKENVLTGKVYFSKDAVKFGLADSIGTLDDAISFIQQNKNTSKKQNTRMENTRPNLNASLQMTADHQITEGGAFLQEAELNSIEASLASVSDINTKLETAQQTISDLTTANQTLTDASVNAQTQIETLTASVADWQAKAEAFGAQRGNDGAAPVAGAEDVNPDANTNGLDALSLSILKNHNGRI